MINITTINTQAGTQSRAAINEDTIAEYAEAMKGGAKFPPIRIFNDGVENYLADGFHRFFAVKKLGKTSIDAVVVTGTLRDAILYSLGSNHEHGLRRTNADKRKSVLIMLEDFEWGSYSDSEIARICKVSQPFVSSIRNESGKAPDVIKYKDKDGAVHEKTRSPAKAKEIPAVKQEEVPEEFEHDPTEEIISTLTEENEKLKDQLAAGGSSSPEETAVLIAELREENKRLHMELKTVKLSRDQFQNENAQLMKQLAALQRQIKKAA